MQGHFDLRLPGAQLPQAEIKIAGCLAFATANASRTE
jgi:hypothetical protein